MGPQFAHAVLEGRSPFAQMRCCMDSSLLYRPPRAHILQRGASPMRVHACSQRWAGRGSTACSDQVVVCLFRDSHLAVPRNSMHVRLEEGRRSDIPPPYGWLFARIINWLQCCESLAMRGRDVQTLRGARPRRFERAAAHAVS
eukprot:UN2829